MQMQLAFDASPLLPRIRERLLATFGPQRADARLGPISQLIKSMLSNRTYDDVAWAAFVKLRSAYPDWSYLAEASSGEVERVIEAVTHAERKAVYIPSALRLVIARVGRLDLSLLAGKTVEEAMHWLRGLPGVGCQNAAAALNFSTMNRRVLVVDGHVHRVCRRLGLVGRTSDVDQAYEALMAAVPEAWTAEDLYELHWLLNRLGQRTCHFGTPSCNSCVLKSVCPRIDAEARPTAEVAAFPTRPQLQLI
jgi:endonuclease-3